MRRHAVRQVLRASSPGETAWDAVQAAVAQAEEDQAAAGDRGLALLVNASALYAAGSCPIQQACPVPA